MVELEPFNDPLVECPMCHAGAMELEPNFKEDGIYDVYTCEICEHMETDYSVSN